MSLTDALLLDPPKIDIWFAVRTDGVQGSGTESDPYNGAPGYEAALSVSGLVSAGRRATATTAASHGYMDGYVVSISGVTGTGAQFYNGTFVIYGITATTFNFWMKADPGASGAGTMTCARTRFQFDDIRGNPALAYRANATIHLGPGVFPTQGVNFITGGVPVVSGQKIIGSGMGVTTVKLVNAAVVDTQHWVIGTGGHIEYFELSDLTLDCNLDGQLIGETTFPPIACSGVLVNGSHLRYRRVRVINFGDLNGNFECFVMWAAGADPNFFESVDCLIEDCILEQPAINQYGQVTVINMGASERGIDGISGYHRACVVRNCVVDCEYKLNPVAISQITFSGTTATVTTVLPHGRAANDSVRVAGALMNGSPDNPFNGSFTITSVTSTTFQYTMASTPALAPTGEMWVDRFSSHYVAIIGITKTGTGPYTVTVTTATPHFRVKGNNVFVNQVAPGAYNGSFEVTNVPNPTQFQYELDTDPATWTPNGFEFIGIAFQAISNDAGTAAVVEGNRILNTRIGGPYHDSYSSKDVIVRNNHYRAVVSGPYQLMGGVSTLKSGASLTHAGLTATFTTQLNHGFVVGQAVQIFGATIHSGATPPAGSYNDFYTVDSVPTLTSFTYTMLVDPQAIADGPPSFPAPTFGGVWQEGRLIIENNIIELIGTINTYGSPVGIEHFLSKGIGSQYALKQGIIRGNIIRHVETVSDPFKTPLPLGIRVVSYENVIIEDNVIDLISTVPFQHSGCKNVKAFNNRTPSGDLIQGYDTTTLNKDDELATRIEDAQLLGL